MRATPLLAAMPSPTFSLKKLAELLLSRHASEEPAPGDRRGNARTNPPQPPPLGDAGITQWARDAGGCLEAGKFAESLDGAQVESELSEFFRETPGFGNFDFIVARDR